jgi:hypothetical protein
LIENPSPSNKGLSGHACISYAAIFANQPKFIVSLAYQPPAKIGRDQGNSIPVFGPLMAFDCIINHLYTNE